MANKNSLNNTIGNIVIFTSWIVLISVIILGVVLWQKTNNFVFIISGLIGALGVLFNIYLFSKAKKEKL
jgi:hypothetical protein